MISQPGTGDFFSFKNNGRLEKATGRSVPQAKRKGQSSLFASSVLVCFSCVPSINLLIKVILV